MPTEQKQHSIRPAGSISSSKPRPRSWLQPARWRQLLAQLAVSPAFAYSTILLLQIKVIWKIWQYRDLTTDDTASYFSIAYTLVHKGTISIVWSPLYTLFYACFLSVTPDAYIATTLHRAAMVLIIAVLFLALARRLLPAPVAWAIAAWWVLLPADFDSYYEVHLFAVIPLLLTYLVILYKPSRRVRGAALGILFASSVLMRNEHILALLFLGAAVVIYEFRLLREMRPAPLPVRDFLVSYGFPIVLVCLATAFVYWKADDKYPRFSEVARYKHQRNICQVYAYGYKQRHPEWTKSPWTECQDLMLPTFGKPELSLTEAVWRNPRAMMEHFLWNAGLIPNGLQILLFNQTSGNVNPDYTPVHSGSKRALIETILLAGVYVWGLYKILTQRAYWWNQWIKPNIWGWLAMASPLIMSLVIMLTQRPRPEYLFSVSLFLMPLAGLCAYAIVHRWRFYGWCEIAFPVLVLVLLWIVPPYYRTVTYRPLALTYETLKPFTGEFERPGAVAIVPLISAQPLCFYLAGGNCNILPYWLPRVEKKTDADWLPTLQKHGINLFYVDEGVLADPQKPSFISNPEAFGWKRIGFADKGERRWMLLERQTP